MRSRTSWRRLPRRGAALAGALFFRSLGAAALLAAAGLSPPSAMAQTTTGVITGSVTDAATRRGLPDVVVEVAGPTGEQVAVTDSSGSYRIPNLPPGAYSVRVSNEGYRPSGTTVTLSANQTIRANVNLAPLAIQAEEIVVVGKAPTVDIGSTQAGVTMSTDFTSRVPLSRPGGRGGAARSFESIAEVAPGAKADNYGVSIAGTTSPENQYIVDGMSVNNPAYGIAGTPLSIEFVKEVSVITGGYMPEYGRSTGGVLNVITKSGTNQFHGSVFLNISPGALEGQRARVRPAAQALITDANVDIVHDIGGDIGGPIVKNRLFFYAGFGFNSTRYRIEQNLQRRLLDPQKPYVDAAGTTIGHDFLRDEGGVPLTERIPGTTQVRPAIERGLQYVGKLTFLVTPDHRLELTVSGAPSTSGGAGVWGINPQTGAPQGGAGDFSALANRFVSEANDVGLKYSGAFDNKSLLVDAMLGWHHQRSARLPSDGSEMGSGEGLAGLPSTVWQRSSPYRHSITEFRDVPGGEATCSGGIYTDLDPAVDSNDDGDPANDFVRRDPQCPVNRYWTGGPDYLDEQLMDRVHGRLVVTKLLQALGHHVVKAGLDVEYLSYHHTKAYSGRVRFAEEPTGEFFSDQRQYGFLIGPDQPVIQDTQKAFSQGTSIGAFLQDSWSVLDRVTLNLGVRWDSQLLFGDDGRLEIALPYQFGPRIGAIYDITQRGASKIYASFARYYEAIPLNLVDRAFPGESQIMSHHDPALCNPRIPEQARGVCQSDASRIPIARARLRPDRGLQRGEAESAMDPSQYWTALGSARVPVEPNLQPQAQDEVVLGGEYEVFPDGRLGVQYTRRYLVDIIEDMSRDDGVTYFLGNPGSGMAKDFPKARREYDAVALYLTKNLSDRWLAQVSYTLSYLRGNIAGLYRPETGQLDPNINSDFDLRSQLVNRFGPLDSDTTHEFKVYLARDFPLNELFRGPDDMQINLGVGYTGTSGNPTSFLGAHYRYGPGEVHILPRGSGERLPFLHRFNTHVQYDLALSASARLSVFVDVFNLFNFQQVTAVDQNYTFAQVRPLVGERPVRVGDGLEPDAARLVRRNGTPFDPATDRNPNFGEPSGYQSPRTFRFGMRMSF